MTLSQTAEGDPALRGRVIARLQEASRIRPSLLNIIVHDGTVELWGTVDSETEKRAILVALEVTPGIRGVNDNLLVEFAI